MTASDEPAPGERATDIEAAGTESAAPETVGLRCGECGRSNGVGAETCTACGAPIATQKTVIVGRHAIAPIAYASSDTLIAEGAVTAPSPVMTMSSARQMRSDPPPSSRAYSSSSYDEMEGPLADPLIGVVVAERYRILERLGRGGMGIVYKVEHTRIGKLLAMKLLTGELSRNREVVRRFKLEALTSSKLSSPNTVQVFDFGVSDRLTYLVMELVAGEDLSRTLKTSGPMPFSRLGRIVVQMCSSLAEAHQKGIVHRDIKPENVMLVRTRDGTDLAKVLDFGLAKIRESSELNDVTSQGAIVGTPYFMSPEQVRGDPVDARSDIYSLGALMYRALTGHYPFNGPTPMAVFTKHLTEMPVPPHERAPEEAIAGGVSAIVMKALAKDAEDRWSKVEELQAALIEALRASGGPSLEQLLDSGALRKLAKGSGPAESETATAGVTPPAVEIATRDEVERYERKLRRQRYGAVVLFALIVIAAGGMGVRFALAEMEPKFEGREMEPNDAAASATRVPFGSSATALLGRRLDEAHGDRDFFSFDVPAPPGGGDALVHLSVGSVPNFAMCTLMFKQGYTSPLAQYCVGRPGRDLDVDPLRVEPGHYLVAVMQDLDPYGAQAAPFIHENVSDAYVVSLGPSTAELDEEIEPNDQVASGNAIAVGAMLRGAIAWARDEDMFCVEGGVISAIQWRVRDVVRAGGTALEVTPMTGTQEGAALRIHPTASGQVSSTDQQSPWTSEPIEVDPDFPRCLRVRLTHDPWTVGPPSMVPTGGSEEYAVEVIAP